MVKNKKLLRVGIAGFGVVGKRRKDCVDRNPHLSLVAVCDKTFGEKSMLVDGIFRYQDYHHLLKERLEVLKGCNCEEYEELKELIEEN